MRNHTFTYRAAGARSGFLTALVLVCLLILNGCSGSADKKEKTVERRKKVVPVTIGLSEVKTVPLALNAIGTVEAFATVAIKSQITGTLKSVHFKEGDDVKKGDLLFTIDERPFTAMLNQAQGSLARDKAELANAEKELRRYTLAAGKGYVSSEQADTAATRVATMAATVKADEATVVNARLQLEFCSILSPIDGRTGELLVNAGNLIKANADDAMVTIKQITPIKVSFTVPGKYLPEIKKYRAAGSLEVQLPGIGDQPLAGAFAFLDNRVDTTTGTILLKAIFTNEERSLWPGQFVDVHLILTSLPDTIVVPTPAIQVRQDGAHIYVVKDDQTVADRLVKTGMMVDGETVVYSGIAGGERVVTNGQLQLGDGVKVEDRNGPAANKSGERAAEQAENKGKKQLSGQPPATEADKGEGQGKS